MRGHHGPRCTSGAVPRVCGSELAPGTTVCLACQGNKRGGAAAPGGAWNGRSCWSLLAGAFLMLGSVAVATRLMAPRK